MDIRLERLNEKTVVFFLSGRLDTVSSYSFEHELNRLIDGNIDIILDLKDLSYICSSGLHLLLHAHMTMNANNRKLVIRNVGVSVKDVFEMTGFTSVITLE